MYVAREFVPRSWASAVEAQLYEQGRELARESEDSAELASSLIPQKEYVGSLEARLIEAEEQLTWIKATLQGPFKDQAEGRPTCVDPCFARHRRQS